MKEVWTITNEDAEKVMNILALLVENQGQDDLEAIKNVHAALMWADRIEIEG